MHPRGVLRMQKNSKRLQESDNAGQQLKAQKIHPEIQRSGQKGHMKKRKAQAGFNLAN